MKAVKIISVDFQKDFSAPGGKGYRPRPCVDFIKTELLPYSRSRGLKIAEIKSEYRLPRPGDEFECCVPGTPGYESEIPPDLVSGPAWIKAMNSPVWTRANAGLGEMPWAALSGSGRLYGLAGPGHRVSRGCRRGGINRSDSGLLRVMHGAGAELPRLPGELPCRSG